MAFEKFIRKHGGYNTAPAVSLWARGQVAFNSAAVKGFGLVEGYVNLLHDAEANKIGFEFLTEPEEGSLKLKKSHGYLQCMCKPFINSLGIDLKGEEVTETAEDGSTKTTIKNKRCQFPLEFADGGMLVADLSAGDDTEDDDGTLE